MALGPIQGWNTVRCAIFHEGRCERARVIEHGGKNTGELHPDQIKGAVDRNYRIANRGGPIELTIDEDATLAIRTDLERFLTQ